MCVGGAGRGGSRAQIEWDGMGYTFFLSKSPSFYLRGEKKINLTCRFFIFEFPEHLEPGARSRDMFPWERTAF